MSLVRTAVRGAMALAIAAGVAAPAGATTLVRASLDKLVRGNATVVVGEVVDAHSYWNDEGTFILTDVRVVADDVVKGKVSDREFTVTLMGGRVGDLTTLIVGGPELLPGRAYVMFLNNEDLPGVKKALTVRDLVQGVYDLEVGGDGVRAISQANRHPLVPDSLGYVDAPGGVEGLPYEAMLESIRTIAKNPELANREVSE